MTAPTTTNEARDTLAAELKTVQQILDDVIARLDRIEVSGLLEKVVAGARAAQVPARQAAHLVDVNIGDAALSAAGYARMSLESVRNAQNATRRLADVEAEAARGKP